MPAARPSANKLLAACAKREKKHAKIHQNRGYTNECITLVYRGQIDAG